MTQLQSYTAFVSGHGYRVTLGEILRTEFAAEYRKQNTLLRHDGWKVEVELRKPAGENVYTFQRPVQTDQNGQRMFA